MIDELKTIKALGRFISDDERRDLKLVEFLQSYRKKLKHEKSLIGNVYELDPNSE